MELSRSGFDVILERRIVVRFRRRDIAAAGFGPRVFGVGCGELLHCVFELLQRCVIGQLVLHPERRPQLPVPAQKIHQSPIRRLQIRPQDIISTPEALIA